MRYYDTKTGLRFDHKHPLWPKKPDGEHYKVLTAKAKRELAEAGSVILVPSVTEELGFLANKGLIDWAFQAGVEYGFEFGRDNPFNDPSEAIEYAEEKRFEPAEAGTNIHAEIENPNSDMHNYVRMFVLDRLGIDINNGKHEVQFAVPKYGGTIDYIDDTAIIDWKSSCKERKPYKTEACQLALYNAPFNRQRLINIYIDQTTRKIYNIKEWNDDEKQLAMQIAEMCVGMFELVDAWKD